MKKGVSAIIATILLLMITIALAGAAYIYMSGIVTGRTSKAISILDASCTNNTIDTITIVLSNDGTMDISITNDLKFFIDNQLSAFTPSGGETEIVPHNTTVFANTSTVDRKGTYTLLMTSPSNSVRQTVYC